MKSKDLINSVAAMIVQKGPKISASDTLNRSKKLDISYEEGIQFFGSLMERILTSIDKIESNFNKMNDQD